MPPQADKDAVNLYLHRVKKRCIAHNPEPDAGKQAHGQQAGTQLVLVAEADNRTGFARLQFRKLYVGWLLHVIVTSLINYFLYMWIDDTAAYATDGR